jgi:Fe-Mn family superoxide dismutase
MKLSNRRSFLKSSIGLSVVTVASTALGVNPLSSLVSCSSPEKQNTGGLLANFEQEPLPYSYDALEPFIDARTMEIHYSKHHAAYVTNANDAIQEESISAGSVEEFFANISNYSTKARNNGGGAWNHSFFWKSMQAAKENNAPTGDLLAAIEASFGSFDEFKTAFAAAGASRFGSGWAWLVKDADGLKIGSTPNQDNPLMGDAEIKGTPLLGIDVWEHAYYLHYQNKRGEYIANWWNLVNWDFVAAQYAS